MVLEDKDVAFSLFMASLVFLCCAVKAESLSNCLLTHT